METITVGVDGSKSWEAVGPESVDRACRQIDHRVFVDERRRPVAADDLHCGEIGPLRDHAALGKASLGGGARPTARAGVSGPLG